MDRMMVGIGAQLRAIGPALQTLPKPPYIVLAPHGTTALSALSGMYVPIYMHKYLHDAADASKGGVFTFAFVKGPVNQEMYTVPSDKAQREGSVITYTAGLFEGDYLPRIKPPPGVRDPLTGAPSRDLRREPTLIVTFEIAAVRKITVDLGLGVAIGPTATPALATRYESFYMDAQSWWAATSGVQQKLRGGTVTFLQDLAEMRDVRETLTLKVLGDKNNADFTGSYLPVRYVKERQPGGSRITVALLNKEQGAPLNEVLRVSLGSQPGAMNLFDPRFYREILGRRDPVTIPLSMKVSSPLVNLELTLNAQGRVTKATMALMRVNPDMTRSDPVAVLSLTDAMWLAATSTTGPLVIDINEMQNKMQLEVRAKHGDIVDRDLRGIAPVPAPTLVPQPSGPGSNETLTLDVQIASGSIVKDFSGKYVPVHYKKRQSARLGGGSFVEITMLNMDRGGPKTENLVKIGMPQQKEGEMTLLDNRYFALMPGGTEIVPIRGKMIPGLPCVILSVPLKSWGTITEVTMALARTSADMRVINPVAVFGFNVIKAEEGTGHTISRPKEWTINVKANRAKILR
jgi:hypothetical protein